MTTYIFSHYLTPWFMPPGVQILLAIVGIILFRVRPLLSKILFVISISTLWLASAPIVAYNLLDILQNEYSVLPLQSLNSPYFTHSAIVVLGGGDDTNVEQGNIHTVSETTLNRLRYAAYLVKKTHLPLIVSGGRENGSVESEADLMAKTMQDDFAISTAMKEDKSMNTAEESVYVAALLKQYQLNGIYLVTNAWHMPRSMMSFERAGIQVIPAPMGYKVYDHHYTLLSYLPNVQALEATNVALHEWIGMIWYKMILTKQSRHATEKQQI